MPGKHRYRAKSSWSPSIFYPLDGGRRYRGKHHKKRRGK